MMMVGPMKPTPRPLIGAGALARAISSAAMACCIGVAPRPPYSFGQPIPTKPASYIVRCQARRSSRVLSSRPGTLRANHARVWSRNARSSGDRFRSISGLQSGRHGQPVDRRVQDVRDGTGARHDHEVELDELAPLLLEQRAHLAAHGQLLAHARAAEMAHDTAGVDPRPDRGVA